MQPATLIIRKGGRRFAFWAVFLLRGKTRVAQNLGAADSVSGSTSGPSQRRSDVTAHAGTFFFRPTPFVSARR